MQAWLTGKDRIFQHHIVQKKKSKETNQIIT